MRLSNVFELMLLLAVAATYVGTSFGEMNSTANATTAVLTSGAESKDKVGDISQVIVIKDINYEAPSPERENLNGEWVEITNRGSAVQNMNGWKLLDEGNHTYSFKEYSLNAGATVRIHTGQGEDTEADLYWKSKSPIWNNGGDAATLKDEEGDVVASFSYPRDEKK
jgi:hypothetical protein